ncbi:MAG: YwaF family protein [Clostridia bacterium]|nr:YwaF family protein [Clostridia bacterium]
MWGFLDLIKNFFTNKDFLPSADKIPGTMFTPLHFIVSAILIALVVFLSIYVAKKKANSIKKIFTVIWILAVSLEAVKIAWETLTSRGGTFEAGGVLPLYPCSIFMYALPLIIFGKGYIKEAGCGYICTLGIVGGTINFVYPATILGNYSIISFSGFHTMFYHGAIVFCALTLIISRFHTFNWVKKWWELFIPAVPFFAVSIIANIVNFSSINSDYMFFKLNSFIFAPIGEATPDFVAVIIVYIAYIIIHAVPYLPGFIKNLKANKNS